MADFDRVIDVVLRHEGGYVNNPNDPGGATKYGVSLRFLADYTQYDVTGDGKITVDDIKAMTVDDAKKIYKDLWWNKFGYSRIADDTIATKVFDYAVNMGAGQAHKLLQRAINRAFGMKLVDDGVLGPNTLSVLNNIDHDDAAEDHLIAEYSNVVWEFYQMLISKNPKLAVFAKGWKARAFSVVRPSKPAAKQK